MAGERVHISRDKAQAPITEAEDQAGALALKTYIDNMLEANGKAWEEMFIPDTVFVTGAQDAIEAADNADDQSTAGRSAAACAALRAAIDSTGQGDQVSDLNIQEGVTAILTAVAKVRAQENPPQKPQPAVLTPAQQELEPSTDESDADDDTDDDDEEGSTGVAGAMPSD